MHKQKATVFVLGLLMAFPAAKAGTTELCNSRGSEAQSRAAYRRALETAAPGSSLYTPHPFPKSSADVVDDFLFYHRNAFSDTGRQQMPSADARFFELLDAGNARFEVTQVDNWTPLRCGPRKERAFYFLVRVFNRNSGEELLRASVEDNGHVARVRHKPEHAPLLPIVTLSEAAAAIHEQTGAKPQEPLYIAAWGTIHCDEVQPCVASESGADLYVMEGDARRSIYRLDSSERLSFRRDLQPAGLGTRIESLHRSGKELISMGSDSFATATRLSGPPQR